jgi:hypothetical protein
MVTKVLSGVSIVASVTIVTIVTIVTDAFSRVAQACDPRGF